MTDDKIRLPTNPAEVGTILKIIHLIGGKATFADISEPQRHHETRFEPTYSADLIRRVLDSCTYQDEQTIGADSNDHAYLKILEKQEEERGRGRPKVPYTLRYDAAYVIAITIQRRFYIAYIADLAGNPIIHDDESIIYEREWEKDEPRYTEIESIIQTLIDQHSQFADSSIRTILAIAVTAPGPIDTQRGIIQSRQMGSITGYSIVDELTEHFGIRTIIHEDSQAFALAEMYAGRRELSAIVITLGEGFGYAVSHEGKLLEGSSGPWQSSSHFVLPNVEPVIVCPDCHRAGCLRAYLGKKGRKALQAIEPSWKGQGSVAAQRLTQSLFAHVVAIQAITFDPAHVALDIGSQYLQPFDNDVPIYNPQQLIQEIRELATIPGRPIPTIEISKLQPSPRARGAGILTLQELFKHPDIGYWRQLSRTQRRELPL